MSEMYDEEIERRLTAEVARLTLEVRRLEALASEVEVTTLGDPDRRIRCSACGNVRSEPRTTAPCVRCGKPTPSGWHFVQLCNACLALGPQPREAS